VKPEQLEVDRLRRKVTKLKPERDILKKGRSFLREGSDMKFAFIAKHRSIWPGHGNAKRWASPDPASTRGSLAAAARES
jgi:hypothetical protein